jgi:hypothetical protein
MPMNRSANSMVVQLAPEVTLLTALAATKQLQSIGFEPDPDVGIDTFRPAGTKFITQAVPTRFATTLRVTGRPSYDELQYILASVTRKTTPTTDGTLPKLWTFEIGQSSIDEPQSFTLEHGAIPDTNGFRYPGVVINELGLALTRDGLELSGSAFGGKLVNPFTMTTQSGSFFLPQVPIQASTFNIFWDATSAGLGTTKLLNCYRAEMRIGNRFTREWPINSSLPSYGGVVESVPDAGCTLRVLTDTQGLAFYNTYLAAGSTGFLRVEALDALIETGKPYRFAWEQAGKVIANPSMQVDDDKHLMEINLGAVYDGTWTHALQVLLRNKQASL